jgi:DNA-binding response OmpR family regulator
LREQDDRRRIILAPEGTPAMTTPDQRAEILIIEDDAALAEELADAFADHEMVARIEGDWSAALRLLEEWHPDLILLDQRLGPVNTLLRLPQLRELTAAPVLILTGNRTEADRIIGLELGADDSLLKPIASRELVARIRAHLRRAQRPGPEPTRGDWRMLAAGRRLLRPDGSAVPLTATEFALLALLASKPGVAMDRETLTRSVLHRAYRGEDRSLDNLVHQIRRKLGRRGAGEVITAVRSQGYAFGGFPEA